ncbi:phage late control D family protein [Candidatus Williamhamiltonella defendens]|uniref:phage late control D family protein n=1 Tax=Candidatus Williamhamiltonella defendens TaxID=138072 RepID=UPI000C1EBE34|nr:contractile injection system protein, VgrG/Pvc8 family [Candidatus Hamiltonella defensa]
MGLTPAFKVMAESQDITRKISHRLLSLTVTDNAGIQSDTVEIRLDDKDHELILPRTGAELEVSLGYKESGVERMGLYVVDEIDILGPSDVMVIRGKAANMNKGLKEPRTRTWQKPGKTPARITLKEILDSIAGEHHLTPKLSDEFGTIDYEVVNQTHEHDLNLLTRLGAKVGAVAKPASGFLLFVKKGEAKTASGALLRPLYLTPKEVTHWRVSLVERGAYASVKAKYRDHAQSKEMEVTTGDEKPAYTLRKLFKDEAEASKAARAQLENFERGKSTVSLQLPGNPLFMAEAPLHLSGFREGVNGAWVIETATHTFNSEGYSVSLDGTVKKKTP